MRLREVVTGMAAVLIMFGSYHDAGALVLERAVIEGVANQRVPEEVSHAIPPLMTGDSSPTGRYGLSENQMISLGRYIFNHVTFDGNGRTCGTCHPASNNFTLDPQYISTLPPRDPLFVAEFVPALANLENPKLMRSFALICENLDGFDKPCVFRGVPHVLALRTSTTAPLESPPNAGNIIVPGTDPPVVLANSTGWSADGAPIGNGANGELRLFAVGAVVQHFTKSLNRVPGVDFRIPSDLELDALLEFMLSLGRQSDVDLASLTFKSPVVEFGKKLFQDQDLQKGGRCSLCHNNASANRPPNNPNAGKNTIANTRVELTANTPAFLLQPEAIVVDGGFGKPPAISPTIPERDPLPAAGFGNGTFKAPPLIEAAATPPFFHNNSVTTIEAAVRFYGTPEFNQNPGQPIILMNNDKAITIAAFLRAIGSVELIDRALSNNLAATDDLFDTDFLAASLANIRSSLSVLQGGAFLLFPEAQLQLQYAGELESRALESKSRPTRKNLLQQAAAVLNATRTLIVE